MSSWCPLDFLSHLDITVKYAYRVLAQRWSRGLMCGECCVSLSFVSWDTFSLFASFMFSLLNSWNLECAASTWLCKFGFLILWCGFLFSWSLSCMLVFVVFHRWKLVQPCRVCAVWLDEKKATRGMPENVSSHPLPHCCFSSRMIVNRFHWQSSLFVAWLWREVCVCLVWGVMACSLVSASSFLKALPESAVPCELLLGLFLVWFSWSVKAAVGF